MKDQGTKVSVVIPTHDRNDFLERAVRSASAQVLRPVEIVVVDDLAMSGTRALCESLEAELGVSVRYATNTPDGGGAPGSRNLGATLASGDLLAFLDDDDYWNPNYLRDAVSELTTQGSQMNLAGLMEAWGDDDTRPGEIPPAEYDQNLLFFYNPGVLCSNVLIDRKTFDAIGGYDVSVKGSCDKALLIQLHMNGFTHSVVKDRLVYWSRHDDQWSVDQSRVRPSVLALYKKYWRSMGFVTHARMIRKLIRLYVGV